MRWQISDCRVPHLLTGTLSGRGGVLHSEIFHLGSLAALLAAVSVANLLGRVLVESNPLSLRAAGSVVALWLVLGGVLAFGPRPAASTRAIVALAMLMTFPFVQQLDWIWHNSNAGQRARIEYVLQTTGPDEAVFDGYSGFGVFRPHAYRYWFLHDEVRRMLSPAELGPDVIGALQTSKPTIAVVDENIEALPPMVKAYIAEHYEDTPFPDLKRLRAR